MGLEEKRRILEQFLIFQVTKNLLLRFEGLSHELQAMQLWEMFLGQKCKSRDLELKIRDDLSRINPPPFGWILRG